jgi:hypothetical protein
LNRKRSVPVHLPMERRSTAPGSRRRHGDVRRQFRLFNQALADLHSTGEHSPGLEASATAVARVVRRMESATLRAARALR